MTVIGCGRWKYWEDNVDKELHSHTPIFVFKQWQVEALSGARELSVCPEHAARAQCC